MFPPWLPHEIRAKARPIIIKNPNFVIILKVAFLPPSLLTLAAAAVKVGNVVKEHVSRDRDFLLPALQVPVRKGDFTLRREFLLVRMLAKFGTFFPHQHPIPCLRDNNMIPRSISSTELWRVNPAQTIELLRPSLITRKNSEKLFFQNLVCHKLCETINKVTQFSPLHSGLHWPAMTPALRLSAILRLCWRMMGWTRWQSRWSRIWWVSLQWPGYIRPACGEVSH